MTKNKPSIYALTDADGAIRYIGKANCPDARLKTHMLDSRRRDTPVYRWIRKNGQPKMVVLKSDCDDWKSDEISLIAEARLRGDNLLNVAEGGDEPYCPFDVCRANAIRTNSIRPKNLHYTYRVMESQIRVAKRLNPHQVERLEIKFKAFKSAVTTIRKSGRIHILDAALGEWRNLKNNRRIQDA